MRYFAVTAKCGHVGKNKCILITFACFAEDGKEAAAKTRQFPRVKHDHKDAILEVREILFEDFMTLKSKNDADPYLHCKNPQEQRKIPNFESRVIPDRNARRVQMKKKVSPIRHEKTVRREKEMQEDMRVFFREGVVV